MMNHTKIAFLAALLLSTAAYSKPTATAGQPSAGKPSAPVTVAFEQLGPAIVMGVPVSVKAVVTPAADVDALEVRFSLSKGLEAAQRLPLLSPGLQKAGTPSVQTLVLLPRAEGQQYVNVFVTTRQGRQRTRKTVSYPVMVGNVVANKLQAAAQAAPGGERVISMPATELR